MKCTFMISSHEVKRKEEKYYRIVYMICKLHCRQHIQPPV
jgi:hypothetical protein